MSRHISGYKIPLLVSAALLLLCVLATLFSAFIGVMEEMGTDAPLSATDLSGVPQSVMEDASKLAKELVGDYQSRYNTFVNELLALYIEAQDKDIVVLFNAGGWGLGVPAGSSGWQSILEGMQSELQSLGRKALFLSYQRTEANLRGEIDEFVEALSVYPTKANKLAKRVEFLTTHIPDLNVIVAGESNGTIISDSVMNMLRANERVYSIQTGPPFWHRPTMLERTLVVDNNGMRPDAFAEGDAGAILLASAKALLGLAPWDEDAGRILKFLRAPGHDYRWQYPSVYSQITNFLETNFGLKPSSS